MYNHVYSVRIDVILKCVFPVDPAMVPQMIAYTWPLFPIINVSDNLHER